MGTKIEWTDEVWNPTTGCTKVSPGCFRCYAMTFAERFRGVPGHYFESGFDLALRPKMLDRPASWRAPRRVFVNSMSDLFHRDVGDDYIKQVFDRMEAVDRHTYQLLTKRPERLRRFIRLRYGQHSVPKHIWLGVSVETADYGWRVDMLRSIDVPIRFISAEPLLGPIDDVSFSGISWVIVGGESGNGHREMKADWVKSIRDRCVRADIPFFFKQWHKKDSGRELEGQTWNALPGAQS